MTTGTPFVEPREDGLVTEPILRVEDLSIRSSERRILDRISLAIPDHDVTAIIGPSGCGKSTLIRSLNRMVELSPGLSRTGRVLYRGQDIYDPRVSPVVVRQRIGMVFQRPVVFPMSVFENVAFGLRLVHASQEEIEDTVERCLRLAALWPEIGGDLDRPALTLSGGQQQRLCIARALAVEPRVLLLDEPTASLDPAGAQQIESLLFELRERYAVVLVTHNLPQAARIASRTAFLYEGRMIEYDRTRTLFEAPREKLTENYVTGRFG
ncbi:MAG: phosphate ABC transporter ATP-binding protein [Thermoplasmata archaeon]